MELNKLSVLQIVKLIKDGEITCLQLTKYYLKQINKYKSKNAVIEVFDDALTRAKEIDKRVASGENLPSLIGVPILIKDNILYAGKKCTSASKILSNYVAEYNSTVVSKLIDAGVVILGRTNMDEFAMGGSCENSCYGPCRNAYDDSRVSGGSSGGSAVAVALDMCAFALGSDTGGSVRQPASYNGIVGIKPTYGRISRYGLMSFASSLDTVGIFTRNVTDNAYILSILAGQDIHDQTSSNEKVNDYLSSITSSIRGKRIAIIREVNELVNKTEHKDIFQKVIDYCQKNGAIVSETSIKDYKVVLPVYYTIAPAEATSNMNRFDGIKYTSRGKKASDVTSIYKSTRSELLGKEVKRRIMLGNFVLSSEYYNSYYVKAKQIAYKLRKEFNEIFKTNDIVFMPTTYGEAFEIGSKTGDPLSMYIEDMFTVTANILSVPAISIPIGYGSHNLPIGLQILSKPFNESEIYNIADYILQQKGGAL